MTDRDQTDAPSEKRSDIAGRDTPLIRNCWYVACLAEEMTRKPMRRTILEQDILLYRKEDGTPVALQNRCAHRSYPLHLGALNGDRIVCGYHGFEYGPDGRCAHVPALGTARSAIRVQPYPTREIGPFIWIWTGDPDRVDHDKLVEQPWFAESGWRCKAGYHHMRANYLGLHENLADLTHFPFLHSFAKGQVHLARQQVEREVRPDQVCSIVRIENIPIQPAQQEAVQFEGPVTQVTYGISATPALAYGKVCETDSSDPPKTATRYLVHCTTPETPTSTHYYWAVSRNFGLDSKELDGESMALGAFIFKEDVDALEAIERLVESDKRPGFREKIVMSDATGIEVMRMFARLAATEAEPR